MISLKRMRGSAVGVLDGSGVAVEGTVGSTVADGPSVEPMGGVGVAGAVAGGSRVAVVLAVAEGGGVLVGSGIGVAVASAPL